MALEQKKVESILGVSAADAKKIAADAKAQGAFGPVETAHANLIAALDSKNSISEATPFPRH